MISLFQKAGLRYLFTHPWQTILSATGIALGVSVILAIDMANESSLRAFDISMETVSGKATHRLTSKSGSLSFSQFVRIRNEGIEASAPVIEENIRIVGKKSENATFLGLDPFSEEKFRNFFDVSGQGSDQLLKDLLSHKDRVVLPEAFALASGVKPGDSLTVIWQTKKFKVYCQSLIPSSSNTGKNSIDQFVIADIGTADSLFDKNGTIGYIDLILDRQDYDRVVKIMENNSDLQLKESSKSNDTARSLTEAFRLNLNAMSMLGLIVGLFLIYNSMTFSVIQRRKLLGLFRAIGVTRREIYIQILAETVFIGAIGTFTGIVAGIFLGKELLGLVTQSINDLYFVTNVKSVAIPAESIFKAGFAGITGTLLASLYPAYEAATTSPGVVLKRSSIESGLRKKSKYFTLLSMMLFISGTLILVIADAGILLSYFGILLLIISFALLTPFVVVQGVALMQPFVQKLFGNTGKTGLRGIVANLSRTTVAIAALAIAVSATIGVSTMITSFRGTVITWLEQTLVADLFISAPGPVSRKNEPVIEPSILNNLLKIEGVKSIDYYSEAKSTFRGKEIEVFGAGIDPENEYRFKLKAGVPGIAWKEIREGRGALVTETFAYKWKLSIGDTVTFTTLEGLKSVKISAVYYDYSSEMGHISLDYKFFAGLWKNYKISGIGIYLKPGSNSAQIRKTAESLFSSQQNIVIRLNSELRNYSVEIFDRTFVVASLLHLLSVIVAFIGIFSALMSIQLEKEKEMGILRATGLTPGQMFKLISIQTFSMGTLASVIAVPLGMVLAYALIYVINLRSFGWTMDMQVSPFLLIQAFLISIVASVFAGLYPAYKMAITNPAKSLRDE